MNPLFDAARELLHFLASSGFTSCLIGGLVVERWGEPRLTRDVHATVLAEYGGEAAVIDAVLSRFASRRPDARKFALAHRVLVVRASNGVDLDLSLAAFEFEREALGDAVRVRTGRRPVDLLRRGSDRVQGGGCPASGHRGHQNRGQPAGTSLGRRSGSPLASSLRRGEGRPGPRASL